MFKEFSKEANESQRTTLAWIVFVVLYWTGFTIIPAIATVDLTRYPFWTWIFGMIGVMSCYYALKAGYSADSIRGKPIVAFTTLAISCDWSASAYDGIKGYLYWYGGVRMFFHAVALLWATVFFYKTAQSKGKLFVWSSLVLEWIDLIFMSVVIVLLNHITDGCFDNSTCLGYFSVLTIFMVVWFLPIMFGQSATSKAMHIHLIVLDSVTHLPLVLTVIISNGFKVHWFVFVDVAYKLILLLRVYGYHGFYELVVNREEVEKDYKEEMKEIDKDNEPDDDDDNKEKPTPGNNFAE